MQKEKSDILTKLQNGNENSFEEFFRHYYTDLFLWANSIVNNPSAAQDIVMDFFLDFWQKKRFQSITVNLQSYIFKSIKNSCLLHISKEEKISHDIEKYENLEYESDNPIEDIERNQIVYSAINQLPEKCKEVFKRCCIYGLTYNETAEDMEISINTVRTHMKKAFKILRNKLQSSLVLLFYAFKAKSSKSRILTTH